MNVIVKDIEERIDEDSVERLAQLTENMIPEWNCHKSLFLLKLENFIVIEGMKASRFSRRRAGREGRKGTGIGVAPEVLDEVSKLSMISYYTFFGQ